MAECAAHSKKNVKLKELATLPLITNKSGLIYKFKGFFNGFCVIIKDQTEMEQIVEMGNFGKACFSRSYPDFSEPEILRRRVFSNRKKITGSRPKKVVVVPDSDSENDDYFTDLKAEFQLDYSGIKESVNLSLEEAFFLNSELNCLEIRNDSQELSATDLWNLFKNVDKDFVVNYVVYYYFRVRNWVVKTGLKFGGDFLLYKEGPSFYHASYVVIISVVNENGEIVKEFQRRSMKNTLLMGLNRLCETAGKELLICEVIWPTYICKDLFSYENLSQLSIRQILMKRLI